MNALLTRFPFLQVVVAFGSVGVAATLTHFAVGLSIVSVGLATPFYANIVAFLTAFLVSYFGHKHYTFKSDAAHRRALPRFFLLAALGLALNQLIVYLCVDLAGWSYFVALIIVTAVVPAMTYFAGRYWAFK